MSFHRGDRVVSLRKLSVGVFAFALFASLLGCGEDEPEIPKQDTHIRGLWHVYWKYQSMNQGASPKDTQELKSWATTNLTDEDSRKLGLISVEDSFVSPHDGEPYVVLHVKPENYAPTVNDPNNPTMGMGAPIAIHEAKGNNGQRWVAYVNGNVAEVPEADFRRMIAKQK